MLLFIGLNCITLAMERPNIPPHSTERLFLLCANYIFTVVFALEMFVKVRSINGSGKSPNFIIANCPSERVFSYFTFVYKLFYYFYNFYFVHCTSLYLIKSLYKSMYNNSKKFKQIYTWTMDTITLSLHHVDNVSTKGGSDF